MCTFNLETCANNCPHPYLFPDCLDEAMPLLIELPEPREDAPLKAFRSRKRVRRQISPAHERGLT